MKTQNKKHKNLKMFRSSHQWNGYLCLHFSQGLRWHNILHLYESMAICCLFLQSSTSQFHCFIPLPPKTPSFPKDSTFFNWPGAFKTGKCAWRIFLFDGLAISKLKTEAISSLLVQSPTSVEAMLAIIYLKNNSFLFFFL